MSAIRWYRMSEALADHGHSVDIVHGRYKWRPWQPIRDLGPNLREVPLSRARWEDYDVVKTLFHRGFRTLSRYGGAGHPFVISKLGSVVGPEDRDGIYFFGAQREAGFRIQAEIQETSRFISLLTDPAMSLWRECHGDRGNLLLVPGAAEEQIPSPGEDPYPSAPGSRVLFAGNFYSAARGSQAGAHRTLVQKLNTLGAWLRARGVRLYVIGPGDRASLDPSAVTHLGVIPYHRSWDYLRHADVGIVVSAGPFMHNNESTKVYHYLRVGLPTVSEAGFPNDHLIATTGHGFLVPPGDVDALGSAIQNALQQQWDPRDVIDHVLARHTWRRRAAVYDEVIRRTLQR